MKIGKTTKVVTSPKRKIQKVRKFEPSIPVQIPTKVPETVTNWKVDVSMWEMDDVGLKDKIIIITSAT